MGRLIAVLALAGAAAFAAHPRARTPEGAAVPAAHVSTVASVSTSAPASTEAVIDSAERDFAGRQDELGLVGSAPLFGAEGLPKPAR